MTSKTPNAIAAESAVRQIGMEFRRLRDVRGERIEDIAAYLDIKSTYLFGIEQGDLSVIPSKRQAKAMVRGYADYLGLDGPSIIEPMDPIISSLEGDVAPPEPRHFGRFDRTSTMILAGSVMLGMLVGWSWIGDVNQFDLITPVTPDAVSLDAADVDAVAEQVVEAISAEDGGSLIINGDDELSEEAAEAADALLAELKTAIAEDAGVISESIEVDAAGGELDAAAVPAAVEKEDPANVLAALVAERGDGAHIYEAENTDARVIVRALNDVLVQVTSQSRDYVWTQTMKPREMLLVPNRDDLELWTGDAGGIEILLDGAVLAPLGESKSSISGMSLAPTLLEANGLQASGNGAKPTF
ncbi:MAG: RodZ domain-containing protein [Geminicoccaceae bacterium]